MPCYDSRNKQEVIYRDRIVEVPVNNDQLKELSAQAANAMKECSKVLQENREIFEINQELTAVCCALLNEAKRRGVFSDFVFMASTNGQVNVMEFAKSHMSEDEAKMTDFIKHLSQDELETLRELLKKEN